MKGSVKLIPCDKNGKLKLGSDRRVYWIDDVPHRLEITFGGKQINV